MTGHCSAITLPIVEPATNVLVPRALAQQLVDYLKQRPFVEVAKLIEGLLQAPLANVVKQPEQPQPQ